MELCGWDRGDAIAPPRPARDGRLSAAPTHLRGPILAGCGKIISVQQSFDGLQFWDSPVCLVIWSVWSIWLVSCNQTN